MERRIREMRFLDVPVSEPFFDSLRATYPSFDEWFTRKADEPLLAVHDGKELTGVIYLKTEKGPIEDISPPLPSGTWLKVGTLKLRGKGTRLGERVLKRIFDEAIDKGVDGIYMTVFEIHEDLIALFTRYGFSRWGTKGNSSKPETVLMRDLNRVTGDRQADYPLVQLGGAKAWLLAVYPAFHTRLFPDSILKTESEDTVRDIPSANTIHKVYIGRLPLNRMSTNDVVVLYRTSDGEGPARFRSVATSICVVEQVKSKDDFFGEDDFVTRCKAHSVFSADELRQEYRSAKVLYAVRMMYNASFKKRPTRGDLIDIVGISEQPRWDMRQLTLEQFRAVARLGGVDARLVVD